MNCEICGSDPEVIIFIPKKQPDGRYETSVCESCAIQSGMYCQKHDRPHLGFEDETTACTICIEEILEKYGERIAGSLAAAISQSDRASEIQQAINNWQAAISSMLPNISLGELPLAMRVLRTPYAINIARAVVTYSQRMKISPEEVIEKVAEEGAGVILPPEFMED